MGTALPLERAIAVAVGVGGDRHRQLQPNLLLQVVWSDGELTTTRARYSRNAMQHIDGHVHFSYRTACHRSVHTTRNAKRAVHVFRLNAE